MKRTYAPDPRPAKRKVDRHATRRARGALAGCRICGARPVTTHHLVPRSLAGDDIAPNLVPLCGSGTTGCHGLVEARDRTTCARLRFLLSEPELNYVIDKRGLAFLDRYYPPSAEDPQANKEMSQSAVQSE